MYLIISFTSTSFIEPTTFTAFCLFAAGVVVFEREKHLLQLEQEHSFQEYSPNNYLHYPPMQVQQ
jgi:hypothetical protein